MLRISIRKMAAPASSVLHVKARTPEYLGGVKRAPVPDDKVPWTVPWPEYSPIDYTAPVVLKGPAWADPDIGDPSYDAIKFNEMDGKINRTSGFYNYELINRRPINPAGRTGMCGRGLLGKWGPNHAADPIVTRWKKDSTGARILKDGKPILEFVSIKRKDTGEWALPGGMVDAGDTVSATLKKEFGEEALNSLECSEDKKKELEKLVNELFKNGQQVYAGYVDDPRNTDNAWMETVAVNFHDDSGEAYDNINLQAGDDAGAVCWTEANSNTKLYASHFSFIEKTVQLRGGAW